MATKPAVTRIVNIYRMSCGCMSGEYGGENALVLEDTRPRCPQEPAICGGFTFSGFLNELLGDGAKLEVTVKVLRKGRLKKNPWLRPRRARK